MMISGMCASVQAELDDLFAQLTGSPVRVRSVSAQAFSKARQGLSATIFTQINDHLLALAQDYQDAFRWRGLRLVAGDASRLRVSTRAGAHLQAEHYAFALYLPGSELTLHASLQPADGCERQMLFEALDRLTPESDLLLLDRGYPGIALIAALGQKQIPFCMRVDRCGWAAVTAFVDSGAAEHVVQLPPPTARHAACYEIERRPTKVRLIREVTADGQVRVLMTSLLDGERYPAAAFGDLYHQRWRIEEAFKRIKHRLRLEAATGLNHLAFQQDFAAKVVADNLCTLLAACDSEPDADPASLPNRTYALGTLKPILAGCLLALAHCLDALPRALRAVARTRCRVQRGRHYPRKQRCKPHVYRAYRVRC